MPDLLYEKHPEGHYAIFTMNRPERLNALGGDMSELFSRAIVDFTSDDEMHVGIITGTGRAFSAGGDQKETAERNAQVMEVEARFERGEITNEEREQEIIKIKPLTGNPKYQHLVTTREGSISLSDNRKPFIAAVNGLAVAGGCERAMDCDIRICTPEAYFGLYEIKRGFMPGSGTHAAPRTMPFGEAMYMLLTADNLKAQDAYRIGFVHEVVEQERLIPRAVEIAEMIGANAPLAVQGSKAMAQFYRKLMMRESQQLQDWISSVVYSSEDVIEGPRAFAEKRPPVWKGR